MLWDILGRNRNAFSLAFCLFFSFLCMFWQSNPMSIGVGFIGRFTDRISGALNSTLQIPGVIWVELDKYRELKRRYEAAEKLLQQYRLEKDKFDRLQMENDRLRRALAFPPSKDYPEVQAEVLSIRLNSISSRLVIGKGRNDGIDLFMPVLTRTHDENDNLIQAVVGLVVAVESATAVVHPLIHYEFRLGVHLPGSGKWAILSGNAGSMNEVQLTYLMDEGGPRRQTLHPDEGLVFNQAVYTSGGGGIFPRGIPVGVLIRKGPRRNEFETAFVRPYASISDLSTVSVLIKSPENWAGSERRDRSEDLDEFLLTEFGHPVYPAREETETESEGSTRRARTSAPPVRAPADNRRRLQNVRTGSE